jgi:hypothetical protein
VPAAAGLLLSLSGCELLLGMASVRFWNQTSDVYFDGIRLGSASYIGGPDPGYHTISYYETPAGSHYVERYSGGFWYEDSADPLNVDWGGQCTLYISGSFAGGYWYTLTKEN